MDTEPNKDNTSIENQKAIIAEYCRLRFPTSTVDYYEDRDRSGYTFEQRPGHMSAVPYGYVMTNSKKGLYKVDEAAAPGVGPTWVMHYIHEAVREEFGLPDEWESAALPVMGCPREDVTPNPLHAKKKPLEETVRFV